MNVPPRPAVNESQRLQALAKYGVMDTAPEHEFDAITALAREICETPIALITLIDQSRQWFKSRVGVDVAETPREIAFCAHALNDEGLMMVSDARSDVRFADNPLVTGEPGIRFYAGAPLITPDGETLGTLCVIDRVPRALSEKQRGALMVLSQSVMAQLELRREVREHQRIEATLRQSLEEQARTEQALRETEGMQRKLVAELEIQKERLVEAQTVAKVGSWETDLATMAVSWSAETHHIFETDPMQFMPTHEGFIGLVQAEDREAVRRAFNEALKDTTVHTIEHRIGLPGGRMKWVEERWRVFPGGDGNPARAVGTCRDVTESHQARDEIARSNRALKMLGRCNEALVRAENEPGLLSAICQITVEIGGVRMAWVGYIRDDDRKTIEPRAHAGVEAGYLTEVALTWDEFEPSGQGPAGQSVRSGAPIVVSDLRDPASGFQTTAAAQARGYGGVVCLPLKDGERVFGLLVLYLAETRQMPADEVILLQELADNLAFGILHLRARAERRRTREAVLAMARGLSASIGAAFFSKLAHSLIEALGGNAAVIARFTVPGRLTARTVAAVAEGRTLENFDYPVEGTPCEHLDRADVWVVPRDAGQRYQQVPNLSGLAFEAHVGTTLIGAAGQPIGLMFVQFGQPIEQPDFVSSTLKIFASRAAAELERQDADARTREQASLLDKAQDAIMVRDLEHQITYWNKSAERLYDWSATEALGRSVRTLLYRDPASFDQAMAKLLITGEWVGELNQVRKDGSGVTIEGRWTLVRDEEGRPKSVLAINTDITERKKLEQQFLRAQRMESIGTLAGGIAHDLNNLLAPITMGVELLKRQEPSPKSQHLIDTIERSARRGADLVKQVLSFSRGMEGARVALHVSHVAREIEAITASTFPKNITMEIAISRDLWLVVADPTQIHQVLLNLSVNARDAMPDGGTIKVEVSNREIDAQYAVMNHGATVGRYVLIQVTDSGCGMSREVIDRIFEPFFTTKELGKGTGLGLSTVLGIVRSHGGFVTVYSEPGKGSTFKVYLPAELEGAAVDAARSRENVMPRGNGERILVVDDEISILSVTRQTLEAFGYQVLTAEDGAQAIALFATHRDEVALVLTDMMMPVMDGSALIVALRRIDPKIAIIAASGLAANGSVARVAGAGGEHFLAKPYSADAMLRLIKRALTGQGESQTPFEHSRP